MQQIFKKLLKLLKLDVENQKKGEKSFSPSFIKMVKYAIINVAIENSYTLHRGYSLRNGWNRAQVVLSQRSYV